jgi:hypothetical protein
MNWRRWPCLLWAVHWLLLDLSLSTRADDVRLQFAGSRLAEACCYPDLSAFLYYCLFSATVLAPKGSVQFITEFVRDTLCARVGQQYV